MYFKVSFIKIPREQVFKRSCEVPRAIIDVIQELESILVISHEFSKRLMSHLHGNPVNPIDDIFNAEIH